jgi:hypothetical protein
VKAELWHLSGNLEYVEGFHPSDLYKIIGSSYGLALSKSLELGN